MASFDYDKVKGRARVFFRLGGRQFNRTVKVGSAREADRLRALVEQTVVDVTLGRLPIPDGADVAAFVLSGGKVVQRPEAEAPAPAKPVTLADLFDRCKADPPPNLEPSSRKTFEIHFRRILEVHPGATVRDYGKFDAQEYVRRRSKATYRGQTIKRQTIEKELQSFRQAWAWVAGRCPDVSPPSFAVKDLTLPKAKEQHPFMTWAEIEREVGRGGLSDRETRALWDALWLDKGQVREFLSFVAGAGAVAWFHPMACAAAFTGARRSELCRSRIADWKFEDSVVRIRQKKRDRDKEYTFRDVPLHPELGEVMRAWLGQHPGGQHALCMPDRSPVTWDEASWHFRVVVEGSKWGVLRGWHVLRHSFASNLAAAGVDQRKIDRWMGHSTDLRWRYQHIRPEDRREAIAVL